MFSQTSDDDMVEARVVCVCVSENSLAVMTPVAAGSSDPDRTALTADALNKKL